MYRVFSLHAFSLIETLITLVIIVIAFFWLSPVIFSLQDGVKLQSEVENLQSFIHQIQTKARYEKQNYALTISQNNATNQWCVIAIKKPKNDNKRIVCDCLNLKSCVLNDTYFLYQNQFPQIVLKNKSLYPNPFISIDGITGQLESKCLNMTLNNETEILQFEQGGRVYAMPKNKRTNCRD